MIRSGMDRTRYDQLVHEDDQPEDRLGYHPSMHDNLNVYNPQPGMSYQWVRRTQGAIGRENRRGWRVVRPEDPERTGETQNEEFAAANLEPGPVTKGLVLMRTPIENFRKLETAHDEYSRSRSDGAITGSDYLNKDRVTGTSAAPGTSEEKRVYLRQRDHGMTEVDRPEGARF